MDFKIIEEINSSRDLRTDYIVMPNMLTASFTLPSVFETF